MQWLESSELGTVSCSGLWVQLRVRLPAGGFGSAFCSCRR